MNIEQLRRSLKTQWLAYYRDNRSWLTKLGIWVNCEGQRRPSSSFILAALSTLEPQLTEVLPLVVDLSSNPDRIVIALGLNFNPDDELEALAALEPATLEAMKMLPASSYVSLPHLSSTGEQRSPVIQPAEATPDLSQEPEPREVVSREPEAPEPEASKPAVDSTRQFNSRSRLSESSPSSTPLANPRKPSQSASQPSSNQPQYNQPQFDLPKPNQPQFDQLAPEEQSPNRRPPMDTAELSPGQLPERN